MSELLFSSYRLGRVELKNRVVMSPMTRNRAVAGVPSDLAVTYYAQRAEAGLIVTEGTAPAPEGLGYARIPGLFNTDHVRAWKKVTSAVHAEGGRIIVQLMHTGRASHPDNLGAGVRMVAPSAIALGDNIVVDGKGPVPAPVPEAMSEADIEHAIAQYAHSAELAIEAGFEGIELHAANGYLIEQFLNTASNQRTDAWGGSVENRIRFAVEVARRTSARIGADRVGIRVSPYGAFNNMKSDDGGVEDVHESLARALSGLGLLYLHVVDHSAMGAPPVPQSIKQKLRAAFKGTLILSGGYDRAEADLVEGRGDLVAFGRPFVANPHLVTRLRNGTKLAQPDYTTLYTPGSKGYTDYPVEA